MTPITLSLKSTQTYKSLINQLVDFDYHRVSMVMEPGDFSVRGSIIDVFPLNQSHPLRVEYFGDDIDRISSFNCHNQRSISNILSTEIRPFDRQKTVMPYLDQAPVNDALLSEIQEGDYLVHEDYGVGRFKGLVRLNIGDREGEFLHLAYKGEDKVYVPLDQLQLIHRYADNELVPKVNALHDGSWNRTRARIERDIIVLAEEIYHLYKTRKEEEGFACSDDTVWQCEMEQAFPHKETKDQLRVISEVKRDMESFKPMDRLICGDVGYGKTEIIIRAAFKALENNKQVAILVPTTLLAEQHGKVFRERFKAYPYFVDVLNRFKPKQSQLDVIKKLKTHGADLIIGTHRLLQKDIQFKDLGLLIIDEEQRFGVSHKEKLKKFKKNVDVLNVTATPIPRTLYMSLTGARDLSQIITPPFEKKAVITTVSEFDKEVIMAQINRELERNGQVYYVYNRVEKIGAMYTQLSKWFPKARLLVIHGQMNQALLQKHMIAFWQGECDILLCTTIIENGLDVSNANTMIIDLADRLGLSQIHQLRGRVGRAKIQGYAHLTYRSEKRLTEKAQKRLQAVKEYATLGSGYRLAMKDLEIRGAGTLLGHKQSGHMTSIGFDLYCSLLEKSVKRIRGERVEEKPRLNLPQELKIYIPDTYITSSRERLSVYERMMSFEYAYQIEDLVEELEDRYGTLPKIVEMLCEGLKGQLKG